MFQQDPSQVPKQGSLVLLQDADSLKVGVAELINQWVRGSDDGSRCSSPFKPAVSPSSTCGFLQCVKLFFLLSVSVEDETFRTSLKTTGLRFSLSHNPFFLFTRRRKQLVSV